MSKELTRKIQALESKKQKKLEKIEQSQNEINELDVLMKPLLKLQQEEEVLLKKRQAFEAKVKELL